MALWLLTARRDLPDNSNPWIFRYNKCFAMVIRAETETEARDLASKNAGDENRAASIEEGPWRHEGFSRCQKIPETGEPSVILRQVW